MRMLVTGINRDIPINAMQCIASSTRGASSPPSAAARLAPERAASFAAWSSRAASYDATAERWIARPSRVSRDAGAAAELRQASESTVRRSPPFETRPAGPTAAGRFFQEVAEAVTVACGLAVFGALAFFFLVLA